MGQGILLFWLAGHAVTSPGSEKEEKYKNTLSSSKQQIIADQSLLVFLKCCNVALEALGVNLQRFPTMLLSE